MLGLRPQPVGAALFAYVHDHVRAQIYGGVLRGARGTPLASEIGAPWSLCQEVFTAAVDALVELGENIDLDAMTM